MLPAFHAVAQTRFVNDGDFEARNLPGKFYTEYWEYSFVLNESILLNYTFFISDIGAIRDRTIGVRMVIVIPGRKPHVVNKDYEPRHFQHRPERFFLRPHPQRDFVASGPIDSVHHLLFKTGRRQHEYHVQLWMKNIIPGIVTDSPDAHPELGNFNLFTLIADSEVNGFIVIDQDSISVRGRGFMDHVYYPNLPNQVFSSGMNLKFPSRERGFSLLTMDEKKPVWNKKVGIAMRLTQGGRNVEPMLLPLKPFELTPAGPKFEYTLLDELPDFKRFMARNILGREMVEVYQLVRLDSMLGVYHGFYVR